MNVVRIPLDEAKRYGGREVDAGSVALLKESIAAIGLLNPIIVTKAVRNDGPTRVDTYWVVAGKHRVQAVRELGWTEIDAVILDVDAVRAELCEIDENLARSELTDAQRAQAHARREEIMVSLGLVSAPGRGGDRRSNDNLSLGSYAAQASCALGVDKRTVERDLRRGKGIDPEVLAEVAGTALDKGVVLDELARTPQVDQRAKLNEIVGRRESAEPLNRAADRAIRRDASDQFGEWLAAHAAPSESNTIIAWLAASRAGDTINAYKRAIA